MTPQSYFWKIKLALATPTLLLCVGVPGVRTSAESAEPIAELRSPYCPTQPSLLLHRTQLLVEAQAMRLAVHYTSLNTKD